MPPAIKVIDGKKPCATCKRLLPANWQYFYTDNHQKSGLNANCIECLKPRLTSKAIAQSTKRKALGLCARCGQRPPRAGKTICRQCAPLQAANSKRLRENNKARGKCTNCSALLHGSTRSQLCSSCREKKQKAYQRWRHQSRKPEQARLRRVVIETYGGHCACCGEANFSFLTIDHVYGGGKKELKRLGSHHKLYQKIISLSFPEDYQILCYNCNCAKGIYGICPHKANLIVVC